MALTLPQSTDLKVRYPEFTLVSDSLIDAMIGEASHLVDEDWLPQDQQPGILAYTAHLLAMEGYPARANNLQAPLKAGAGREIVSRTVGDVSTTYAQTGTAAGSGPLMLTSTPYGRRFAQLLRLNAPTFQVL